MRLYKFLTEEHINKVQPEVETREIFKRIKELGKNGKELAHNVFLLGNIKSEVLIIAGAHGTENAESEALLKYMKSHPEFAYIPLLNPESYIRGSRDISKDDDKAMKVEGLAPHYKTIISCHEDHNDNKNCFYFYMLGDIDNKTGYDIGIEMFKKGYKTSDRISKLSKDGGYFVNKTDDFPEEWLIEKGDKFFRLEISGRDSYDEKVVNTIRFLDVVLEQMELI